LALGLIANEARGALGLGNEQIVREALIWIPGFIQTIGDSRVEGRIKKAVRYHTIWARYEAISGTLTERRVDPPPLERVAIDNTLLPAAVRPRDIEQKIRRAAACLLEIRQKTARANHASALQRLGMLDERAAKAESEVGAFFRSAEITATEHIVRPFYVAITQRKGQHRVIAIDGHSGRLAPAMGRVLTGHVTHISEALNRHQASRTYLGAPRAGRNQRTHAVSTGPSATSAPGPAGGQSADARARVLIRLARRPRLPP
jgi:hypothetical protein